MDETLLHIIEAGTRAPSGDNSQPWSFTVSRDAIELTIHPERDHALLNVRAGGTLIACGAAIENMVAAARAAGLECEVTPPEDIADPVRLVFSPGSPATADELARAAAIATRHTNRTAYATTPLPDEFVRTSGSLTQYAPCRVAFIAGRERLAQSAHAASAMEEAALGSEQLHRLFFDSLLFSRAPHEAGQPGLHLSTMELPPPVRLLFRLLRSWRVVRFLDRFGFARLAAAGNAATYASSGALIAFIVPDRRPLSMIAAGRAMQRVWLDAVSRGLAAQPLAGLLYLAAALRERSDICPAPAAARVRDAEATLYRIAGASGDEVLAMLLRVGVPASPPTDYSRRLPPAITTRP